MITPEELERRTDQVEALLKKRGIRIVPGSFLETSCLKFVREHSRHQKLAPSPDETRRDMLDMAGTIIIFDRLLLADLDNKLTPSFIGHLKLLAEGVPSQTLPYQGLNLNKETEKKSNQIFELIVGLSLLDVPGASNLELEPPGNSAKSRNPDILVTINGVRWGFACKVSVSPTMRGLRSLIEAGIKQINDANVDSGCVLVSLRNWFPHERVQPKHVRTVYSQGTKEHCYRLPTESDVKRAVLRWFSELGPAFRSENQIEPESCPLFFDGPSADGFVGYFETCTSIADSPELGMPTPWAFCHYLRYGADPTKAPSPVSRLMKALCGPKSMEFEE